MSSAVHCSRSEKADEGGHCGLRPDVMHVWYVLCAFSGAFFVSATSSMLRSRNQAEQQGAQPRVLACLPEVALPLKQTPGRMHRL